MKRALALCSAFFLFSSALLVVSVAEAVQENQAVTESEQPTTGTPETQETTTSDSDNQESNPTSSIHQLKRASLLNPRKHQ